MMVMPVVMVMSCMGMIAIVGMGCYRELLGGLVSQVGAIDPSKMDCLGPFTQQVRNQRIRPASCHF